MASEKSYFNSIRMRMTFAFVLLTTTLMLLVSGGLLFYLHYAATRVTRKSLDLAAERVRNELAETKTGNGFNDFLAENGDSLKMEGLVLMMVDAQGHIVRKSQSAAPMWPHLPEDGWRIRTLPDGPRTIVIGSYWRRKELELQREAGEIAGLSLCVVLASGFGAWWLVGRTLSPIFSLSQQARQAEATDSLHLRLTVPSDDAEVVELVATLNALLTRIGETAEARGRFYAAASHELRTPLQALSGHLEVALSRERSRDEYKAATEEASRQTRRLTDLIQSLLLLNQLDRPAPDLLLRESVDLSEICQRLLTQLQPLIDRRELTVSSDLPPIGELVAFPQHAEMLVRNLIENALKYATPGGCVSVQLRSAGGGTSLEIFNTFPMQTRLDTKALFEPFYRPDEARASDTGGNGLGLAICRAIAAANGWKIALDQVETGVRVTVVFAPAVP
jgi:signal transduction histidine kinase